MWLSDWRSSPRPTSSERINRALQLARYPHLMPDPALYRVHLGRGPDADYPYPDFDTTPIRVYWFGPARRDADLLHEIGHVTQRCYVRDDETHQFDRLLGGPQHRPIWWPPGSDPMARRRTDPFCEPFADAFQWMQTANPMWPRWRRTEFRQLLRPLIERGPLACSDTV